MTHPRRVLAAGTATTPFEEVRAELDVPEAFPGAVVAAAQAAAERGPTFPRDDATEIPLVTIDPPDSMDLDQAVSVENGPGGGLTIHYAIADVAAFVTAGDPIDTEAWERGVSRYSPDLVTPLHPRELSEGAASLLPDQDRPAVLWTLTVDDRGELLDTTIVRATVQSRAKLSYAAAQLAIDNGSDAMLGRLARFGRLRAEREWVRGGISLELPDQEIITAEDGSYGLTFRAPLPVEGWNAQVSLLTGIAAGQIMAAAGIGVLRTLPVPEDHVIQTLRERAWALGLPWPQEINYAAFVRTLDPHESVEAAMIAAAAVGLRGAGYVALEGTGGAAEEAPRHEAIASVYAHVTAPLRRLVDRYGTEVCLAVTAGQPVPEWVTSRLADLPKAMNQARGRSGALNRAMTDLVEAQVLADRVGETFAAVAVRGVGEGTELQLRAPAVIGRVEQSVQPGREVQVRLTAVDLAARTTSFRIV